MPGCQRQFFQRCRIAGIDDLGLDDAAGALPFSCKCLRQAFGQRGVGGNDGRAEQTGIRCTLGALARFGFGRQTEEIQMVGARVIHHIQRQCRRDELGIGGQRGDAVAGDRPGNCNCAFADCLLIQRNDFGGFVVAGVDAYRQSVHFLAGSGEETLLHGIGSLGEDGRFQRQQQRDVGNGRYAGAAKWAKRWRDFGCNRRHHGRLRRSGCGRLNGRLAVAGAGAGTLGAVVGSVAQPNTLTYSAAIRRPRNQREIEGKVCISRPGKNWNAHYM